MLSVISDSDYKEDLSYICNGITEFPKNHHLPPDLRTEISGPTVKIFPNIQDWGSNDPLLHLSFPAKY